jgi:hypothetical protein
MGNALRSRHWRSNLSCRTRLWHGISHWKQWHITTKLNKENGLKAEPTTYEANPQLNTQQGVNLETVYRSLLRIVARLDEMQYTEDMLRQTTEVKLDDLADPASAANTSQG